MSEVKRPKPENSGKRWTVDHDHALLHMVLKKQPIEQVAQAIGRTEKATAMRLAQSIVYRCGKENKNKVCDYLILLDNSIYDFFNIQFFKNRALDKRIFNNGIRR